MKDSSKEDIKLFENICYTEEHVKNILKKQKISWPDFSKWIRGQTGMLLIENKKEIFGYYKSDIDKFIEIYNYRKER